MSTLEQALELLEFKSLDDVTVESLKSSFRKVIKQSHPDKGGHDTNFDNVLSAYVYLSKVLRRLTGGRTSMVSLHVSDVIEERENQFVNELNNLVNDIYDNIDKSNHDEFNKQFNEQFEKYHQCDNQTGYESWLREETKTEHIDISENELNQQFEKYCKLGKPDVTSIVLHLDEMAIGSRGMMGTALIQKNDINFTSNINERPEFTDLYSAYTSDNTIYDKIPEYKDTIKSFEELLKERDIEYKTELERDLEAIALYEKRKLEEEKEHKQKIAEYFKINSSSVWAIRSTENSNKNDSFIKQF